MSAKAEPGHGADHPPWSPASSSDAGRSASVKARFDEDHAACVGLVQHVTPLPWLRGLATR